MRIPNAKRDNDLHRPTQLFHFTEASRGTHRRVTDNEEAPAQLRHLSLLQPIPMALFGLNSLSLERGLNLNTAEKGILGAKTTLAGDGWLPVLVRTDHLPLLLDCRKSLEQSLTLVLEEASSINSVNIIFILDGTPLVDLLLIRVFSVGYSDKSG